jgi:hypothetical protein
MGTSVRQSKGNGAIGIITLLLVIFLIWVLAGGKPFFRHTGRDLKSTVQDAGHDLKSAGRDAAASIRDAVQ